MKRLLFVLVMLLSVPALFAQQNSNVLLTEEGTVYKATVEWSSDNPEVKAASSTYIVLTARQGDEAPRRVYVPATLANSGSNSNPALAYDGEAGVLYIFWLYSPNAMSSELKFVSVDREGNWGTPASFESGAYRMRRNLRIALTHKAGEKDDEGNITYVAETNVHATWWESSGAGEQARYAMLTLTGNEVGIQVRDLSEFVSSKEEPYEVATDFSRELLRHPAIFESSNDESVDVVFGNVETNGFHRVTITPIGHARVRIPVGVKDRDFGPPAFSVAANSTRIDAISPSPDRLLYFFEHDGAMKYVMFRNGQWTAVRSISLSEGMTREMAVNAMRGLIGAH